MRIEGEYRAAALEIGFEASNQHARILTMVRCLVKTFFGYFKCVLKDSTVNTLCTAVSQALKKERLRKNLSMNAIAERAGLSQQMVSYVERGIRRPTLDTIFRMSLALEVDLGKIIRTATKNVELQGL
jgi:DNA-binding XRE family transcriptional regulator